MTDEQALLGALAYFEKLKISPDAWQVCAEALAQMIIRPSYEIKPPKSSPCFLLTEYLTKWPKGVDLYLQILMPIDSELLDRDVVNTLIKDTMREQCIPNLVESWYQILQNYQCTNSEVTYQCLEVVGAYVFINMRLGQMSIEVLWEEACDCLFEVVNKGMDPIDKMKLVESLYQVLQSAGFFSIDQEDVDFLARFSKLVNEMGQSLIVSWSKLVKNGDIKNTQEALQAIETKVALMLQLLIHEDDDISSNIIGFCYDYLHILKQLTVLSDQQKANVEAIILALTYGEEYNFENEGEDEAMFVEYRKQLKLLLDRLAQVSPVTAGLCSQSFYNKIAVYVGRSSSRYDVNSGNIRNQFLSAYICDFGFFIAEPQHIPCVLMAFLDHRGLRHSSAKVRSRTAYRFSRFVRSLNKQMNPFIEDILNRIQDLLELSPPENGHQSLLSSDDQLFIYETAGMLIFSSRPPKVQALMSNLLTPLMEKFKILLEKLMLAQDEERQASLADCLNHAVRFASRTSNAFSNKQTVKQCGHSEVYLNCLQTFWPALSCPLHKGILRSGVRTFLHQMIICPEEEVLPFIPSASEHMLKDCEAEDLQEFIPLINQITDKFKIQVSPFLRQMFMPLLHAVFEVLLRPAEENDQSAALEKQMLRRSYFAFLRTVPGSGMREVTANQGAVEYPDPTAQKTCFIVLSKLEELWGGKDGPVGFADFVYKHIVPACVLAPLKQTFDLADAPTVLALSECAVTLKTIHLKRGPECVQYLQQEYLPSLQAVPEIIQEFCQALRQSDAKKKNYLKVFFQRAKP
uniref:Exportin-T n=1 Tax=Macaca nemestrina TaxID=9545 RepID=A0A2K6BH64_MACNE